MDLLTALLVSPPALTPTHSPLNSQCDLPNAKSNYSILLKDPPYHGLKNHVHYASSSLSAVLYWLIFSLLLADCHIGYLSVLQAHHAAVSHRAFAHALQRVGHFPSPFTLLVYF